MRILLSLALLASAHAETLQYMGYNATSDPSHLAFCGANLWGCIGVSTTSKCGRDIELGPMDRTGTDALTWTYEEGLLKSNRVHSSSWYSHSNEKKCLAPKYVYDGEELMEGQVYPLALERCKTSSRRFRFVFEDDRVKSLAPSQVPFCVTIAGSVPMQSTGSRVSLQACDSDNDQQQKIQVYGDSAIEPFFAAMKDTLGYEDTFDFVFNNPSAGEERSDSPVVFNIYNENDRENSVYSTQVSSPSGTISINANDLVAGDDHLGGNFVAIMMGYSNEVTFTIIDRPHDRYHLCGGASFFGYDDSDSVGAWPFAFLALLLLPLAFCCCPCKKDRNNEDDDDKTEASEFDWKEDGKKVDEELSHAPTDNEEEGSSTSLDDVEVNNVSIATEQPPSDLDLDVENKEA